MVEDGHNMGTSALVSLVTFPILTLTLEGIVIPNIQPAEVEFFSAPDMGLFDITATMGATVTFQFFGAQSYSGTGPFTLLPGTFPLSSSLGFGDVLIFGKFAGTFSGGTVTATTATPEPATLALLGSGLFAMGGLRRKKRLA